MDFLTSSAVLLIDFSSDGSHISPPADGMTARTQSFFFFVGICYGFCMLRMHGADPGLDPVDNLTRRD